MAELIALHEAERRESATFAAPGRGGTFRASELERRPVPEREWLVPGMVPAGTVTLMSGDGGTGKSLLGLQLAVAAALDRNWIGCPVKAGKSLVLSAEDDVDELHRRLATVATSESVALGEMHAIHIMPLAGEDAVLAFLDRDTGMMVPSDLFIEVERVIADLRPVLVVIDNLADVFAGNENSRAEVRQFVGMLRQWAMKYRCGVLLLAHPSLAGLSSGSGSSGSTAWSNSVRSRLFLDRDKSGSDAAPEDPDVRSLKVMKSNYAAAGDAIRLRWQDGVFVAEGQHKTDRLSRSMAQNQADAMFLILLDRFTGQGRPVSDSTGRGYAPAIFASETNNDGITRDGFRAAMSRLFAANRIRIEMEGPPSRQRRRIARVEEA